MKIIRNDSLANRLNGVVDILRESHHRVLDKFHQKQWENSTGYEPRGPESLANDIMALSFSGVDFRPVSFDLGCGDGDWALLTAAAGIPSYGIDASESLIGSAEENYRLALKRGLIRPNTPCKFAVGNMYFGSHLEEYLAMAAEREPDSQGGFTTLPRNVNGDAYTKLEVGLNQAGVVYSFPWSDQMELLCRFLETNTLKGTVIVLPHGPSRRFNAEQLDVPSHDVIGVKR